MGETRRHHYVPRLYLKRFTYDGKHLHSFIIPDKQENVELDLAKSRRNLSVENVCVSKDFYRISPKLANKNIPPLSLEKNFFQDNAEKHFKRVLDILDKKALDVLENEEECKNVALYVTQDITPELFLRIVQMTFIQYYRTTRSREKIEEINNLIKISLKKGSLLEDELIGLDVPYTHADKTFANVYLFRRFLQKLSNYSMIFRISPNRNFFTTDNPVVIHKLGTVGSDILDVNFYRDEFSVYFPLTPYLMLEFYNKDVFPNASKLDGTMTFVDIEYENKVNIYQYINAKKFVFSYKDDFSLFLKSC
jgi:hypothetical protein